MRQRFWDAVASAGLCANNLQITTPTGQHLVTPFLQAGCSSWRPANSVKALKANCIAFKMLSYWSSVVSAVITWITYLVTWQFSAVHCFAWDRDLCTVHVSIIVTICANTSVQFVFCNFWSACHSLLVKSGSTKLPILTTATATVSVFVECY